MTSAAIGSHLQRVRRRLWLIGTTTATLWGVVGASLLLLVGIWFDLLWELAPQARIAATTVAVAGGLIVLSLIAVAVVRSCANRRVARRLDHAGRCGGEIVTGWELEGLAGGFERRTLSPLSGGLARMAVQRAAGVAAAVPAASAVPTRPLGRAVSSLAVLIAGVGLVALCVPGLAWTQWSRFTNPYADVPPFSRARFAVHPGDTQVVYGDSLEITAEVTGAIVDELELAIENDDGSAESLPMFLDPEGHWRTSLAKVTAPATYHVRARRARSAKYRIDVITVPRIQLVQVHVTPPAYTGEEPYAGPVPKDGIAGLPGTKVVVRASSNRPLSSGTMTIAWDRAGNEPTKSTDESSVASSEPIAVDMEPTDEGAHEVVGEFPIQGNGKLQLRVTDAAGQASQEQFTTTVTMLVDQRPLVRLLQPRKQSLATPHATLPVRLAAEDDYGIARAQLFRSLNESRPRLTAVPFDSKRARRVDEQVYLPLSEYGLTPGDVIKLFGRVEDNDPAGAKGTESAVVTVRIISQEEFERMVQVREGFDALMSKYREARRRMEDLASEAKQLRKKMRDQQPDSPVAKELREQTERLLQQLRRESEALQRLAKYRLPYDADQNLSSELDSLATMTDRMAEELEKLLEELDLHHDKLAKQLEKMLGEMEPARDAFDQQAMLPLELLETVFPLIVGQSRFVMLALRQIDLADRLAAFEGQDDEDDPAVKARLRDLEQEQREIREALDSLLSEIETHAEQLPDDEQFDELRRTATEFVRDVRASGAIELMAEAETALGEFSGSRAYEKAREAAEILRKFIKWCEGGGMSACAGQALVFRPSLGQCLGNTIAQLLAAMGLGSGAGDGFGGGAGGQGGYTAHRGGQRSMGLYGSLPGMGEAYGLGAREQGSQDDSLSRYSLGGAGGLSEPSVTLGAVTADASGIGEGMVPLKYRRRVGLYFRRLNEELQEP